MLTTAAKPALNPTQLYLLKVFETVNGEEAMMDIEAMLLGYFQKKVDTRANALWDELDLSNEKVEEMLSLHQRTHYQ
jgi:hypothetical protein